MTTSVGSEVECKEGVEGPSPSTSTRGLKRRAEDAILWNTAYMHTRTLLTATLLTVSLAATGCGLLETNDDEMETLRVEIIQLREDFMDLEAEVSLLARMPATTTTTASSSATTTAASATGAATTTRAPSSAAAPAEEDQAPAPTVPVGLNEEAILTATYEWGPSDPALILQELLGVTADGWYGNGTRAAHAAELEARGLSTDGVPSPPTTAAPEATETTEAPAETTEAPAETTEAPAETTEAPAETTEAPAETTEAPAETTEAPVETTTTAAG
jgi:peptidoglycan hydrolase-like protein with peptidoglycan-binding domain